MTAPSDNPQMQFILERVKPGNADDCFALWACRGEGKGCNRNRYRSQKIHCDDCVATDPSETLGDLQDRMARGNA